jgi:hypothetical protein
LDPKRVDAVFGDGLSRQIFAENQNDAAQGITGAQIQSCWEAIRKEIAKLPDAQALAETYRQLGVKSTLADIQVPQELEQRLLDESPMVRNRLTLMRLRSCLNEK